MNTNISIIGTLSGEQFVALVKTLVTGTVILALTYGAYKYGYSVEGSKAGIAIPLKPTV